MRRATLMLALLLLAAPATAWEIRLEGPVTIRGEGLPPTLTPPPVVVVPPVVVPPVVIPTPPPVEEPFAWPPQPGWTPSDHTARYHYLGFDPRGNAAEPQWYYYRALAEYPNPRYGGTLFACFLPGGERVWAPQNGTPASIRRVCAGGRP